MEKSKVFFTDFRADDGNNLQQKLRKLALAAGLGDFDMEKRFVAIKIHFGEPGNLSYLRPGYAKALVDIIKGKGGLPFLTDCNTLYVGRRKNALEHIDSAYENGFSPFSTGCNVIIADGLRGSDDVAVPVPNGELCRSALIGRAIMDADVFLSLSHFKGHVSTGFGGALKNIGMGCGSRGGKMDMHSSGKPYIKAELCCGCHVCAKHCGQNAISYGENGKAAIDLDKCAGCGRCLGACSFDAICGSYSSANADLCRKIAEYAAAVVSGRPSLHVSIVRDISPLCDCCDFNDSPILPDVGMFASLDPVALDQACADACLRLSPLPGSVLSDNMAAPDFEDHHDHFLNSMPESEWRACLEHAEKIGLGTREYELVTLK